MMRSKNGLLMVGVIIYLLVGFMVLPFKNVYNLGNDITCTYIKPNALKGVLLWPFEWAEYYSEVNK